ncbi:hypothetical protein AX769_18570 [Frondihabitans sp. PAMC 28766]|uniref:hypothetical protein n=1 Tax=Frondihabitans sp. PAMC 28766 TaxID=1795630 RepID=UPI00078DB930|nr:hypothetical protein [Frondihabitans sp. PAMC 28766]AMM21786.1 hypothetical protein AX769_18570 [Frondihabitans sp. PAMC 28766]
MSDREATAQQADPLGVLNQRPVAVVIALFAVALAVGRAATGHDPGTNTALAVVAVVVAAVGALVMILASNAFRAPFTRRSFVVLMACGCLGMVLEAAASYGHDSIIRDDWGSTVVGLLLLACAPFRPGRDIVAATAVASVVSIVVVALEAPYFTAAAPSLLFVVVGTTPLVALGAASTIYSTTFVTLVSQWLERASSMTVESAREMRPVIARSVQQDRVTGLNREVVPFFTDLLERGETTEVDRLRASEVATGIRQRIVDESDRSWLEQVLIDVCPLGQSGTVIDRSHLAEQMNGDQRTALRAVVNAIAVDPDTRASSLGIVLHDDAPFVRALVRVESASADVAIRQHYASYLAVLRILFHDLQIDVSGSFLTLRFSYDQH